MKQSERQDVILKYLYERRDDGKEYSIKEILEILQIETNAVEVGRLANQLAAEKLIELKSLSSILKKAKITAKGISYCENDSFSSKGQSIVQNIHISHSPQANVVINSSRITITQEQRNSSEKVIKEIRDVLIKDTSVSIDQKEEILECLTEIESGLRADKSPKFALRSLLTMSSEISSIASLGISLSQALGLLQG